MASDNSRVVPALGRSALTNLSRMRIAIVGLRGLGAETAKNLILLGPAAIGLLDSEIVDIRDLGSNCFLRESDVGHKSRCEASIPMLRKLNPNVTVLELPSVQPAVLSDYHLLILTDSDERSIEDLDEYCRETGKGFIAASSSGAAGQVFVDFSPTFQILNRNGQDPQVLLIHSISGSEVVFLDDQPLDLREGDTVVLEDVEGLEVNGKEWKVTEVTGGQSVALEGLAEARGTYVKGGVAREVKYPEVVRFASWKECRRNPIFTPAAYFQEHRPVNGKTRQLHLAYLALQRFQLLHGRHPAPLSDSEANECLSLAEAINAELSIVQEINPEYPLLLGKFAALQPVPFATFWGGIVAQEAIKNTGSFRPIGQVMYYDWFPLLRKDSDRQLVADRYFDQTALLGVSASQKLQAMHIFLVGAGALGCEYIKALALMGAACSSGSLEVTDDDHIELSNLSRQFLFQHEHIGRSKSEVATAAAVAMNAALRVRARQERVNEQTQDIYTDFFWDQLDLVLGAVDNVSARLYLDSQCLWHSKPFFESGTKGLSGSSMVILPNQTKSYNDLELGDDKQTVANCTLKRFPHLPEHCIEWARSMFESYFSEAPREAEKFLEGPQDYYSSISTSLNLHDQRMRLEQIRTILRCAEERSFPFCVQLARNIFQTQMHNEIRQLLHALPPDHKTSDGRLFWSSPKRVPHPLAFEVGNEGIVDLIMAAANLYAEIIGIEQVRERETVRALIGDTEELPFVPICMMVDTDESKPATETYGDDESFIQQFKANSFPPSPTPLHPLSFEKDLDSNFHIDFIHSLSNLRCANYELPQGDKLKTRLVAGKIIPAVTTSGATITGAVLIEVYKLLMGLPRDEFRSWYFHLGSNYYVITRPSAPAVIKTGVADATFTNWDQVVLAGPLTLAEALQAIEEKTGAKVSMVTYGDHIIYGFDPTGADKLAMRLEDFVALKTKSPVSASKTSLKLELLCCDSEGKEVKAPSVKYTLAK